MGKVMTPDARKVGEILPPPATTESPNENQENQEPNLSQVAALDAPSREHIARDNKPRTIGKEIAKEIERYFEAKVNPHTIDERARRMAGTFVPPPAIPQEHTEFGENQSPEPEIKAPLRK
jgi:hypothetical protein